MTSRNSSAPITLRTNFSNGDIERYGVSTMGDEAANRRVCIMGIPPEARTRHLLDFFEGHSVEGITIRPQFKGRSYMAFVQFIRPSDFTEALLRNGSKFMGYTITIRPYNKSTKPPQKRRADLSLERPSTETDMSRGTLHSSVGRSSDRTRSPDNARSPDPNRGCARTRSPPRTKSPARARSPPRTKSPLRTKSPSRTRNSSRTRSPPRTKSPVRVRSPDRTRLSERSRHSDRKRSSDRTRSRSSSRDKYKSLRERSPSLDRNFGRLSDPFLANDIPNPSQELFVRQHMALMNSQQQSTTKIPMVHTFGSNGAPLPGYPANGMAQAIAYTQASQASYVSNSGGLFEGNLQRIFSGQQTMPPLPPQLQQPPQPTNSGSNGNEHDTSLPAGVELILKLILEHKSARHLSLFQLDSVMDYLLDQKRVIQHGDSTGAPVPKAIEAPPAPGSDVAKTRSSDDLRHQLDHQSESKASELANKIRRVTGGGFKQEKNN